MLKTMFFRGAVLTLSVMGGICFVEGYIVPAIFVWIAGAAVLYVGFPLIEGSPAQRRGRVLAYIIPAIFFVATSGIILFSRNDQTTVRYVVLMCIITVYVMTAITMFKRIEKR